jgi:peptidoglycan biosynthesis protein MviN/MurJ (putative lipid II flippase)
MNYLFVAYFGMDHRGLALATSCTMTLSFMCLWFMLRRRSGLTNLGERSAVVMLGKVAVASSVMGFFAAVTSRKIEGWLGHDALVAQLLQVGSAIGVALVVLYVVLRLLRVHEVDQAIRALVPAGLRWR